MWPQEALGEKPFPEGSIRYTTGDLKSQGASNSPQEFEYDGKIYSPGRFHHWKTSIEGMKRLAANNRIHKTHDGIRYRRFITDFPYQQYTNIWTDIGMGGFGGDEKIYVVQTSSAVISRCILMTTDPGDLVLDITCGSGTTAYAAEKWGRRWITCDTSRVAIAIARQRLMTATYDSYKLADPEKGISSGFVYKTVPHVTLKSIANNEPPETETLYDDPDKDPGKVRVSGPFTVESLPSPSVMSLEEAASLDPKEQGRQDGFMSQLMATGIRAKGGERIKFSRHDKITGARWIQYSAMTEEESPRRCVVCFADSHTVMDSKRVTNAFNEAYDRVPNANLMIFCAFQFDPEAQNKINTLFWPGVKLLQVEMNDDLLTEDLRKKIASDESFWLVGQPDVELVKRDGKFIVRVLGYDYFSVSKDELISGNADKIAMWGIDPNYNGMTFTPSQIFFPMEGKSGGWTRLSKTLKAEIDSEKMEKFSGIESLPFDVKEDSTIAVKIIDDRGIESMRLLTLEDSE